MFKAGNPLRRPRRSDQRFAWWPKKLDNGTVVWLEWYTRKSYSARYGGR
jgi:hypothetical protein